jgi:hypothetical protein
MASNEIEIPGSTAIVGKLKKIAAGQALNRRHFITALGMTGAAAGTGLLSGCSSSTSSTPAAAATVAQTDVLNFALNLEFLEATFYSYLTTGADINTTKTKVSLLSSGAVTGAPPAAIVFTGTAAQQITDILNEIYFDEWNHVVTLQGLLGSSAIFRPAINLAAAGAITPTNALSIARLFEDVGVTAYNGAVGLLSTSDLRYASQILAVEAFHAGALRLVSIQNPGIAAYIQADSLDVAPVDLGTAALEDAGPTAAGGIFSTAGATTSNATTPAGFPFLRTTSQVLSIVYGPGTGAASGTKSGGFFPSGVNGRINTV